MSQNSKFSKNILVDDYLKKDEIVTSKNIIENQELFNPRENSRKVLNGCHVLVEGHEKVKTLHKGEGMLISSQNNLYREEKQSLNYS